MKTFLKTVFRSIRSNTSKLISIFLIVFLGAAFVGGLGTFEQTTKYSFSDFLVLANTPDLIMKYTDSESTDMFGTFDEDGNLTITLEDQISSVSSVDGVEPIIQLDTASLEGQEYLDGRLPEDFPNTRFYGINEEMEVGSIEVVEGRFPENDDECMVEQSCQTMIEYEIGDVIDTGDLFGEKTVVGIVFNSLNFSRLQEVDLINQEDLEQIIYMPMTAMTTDITVNVEVMPGVTIDYTYSYQFPVTDLWISLDMEDCKTDNIFNDPYLDYVNEEEAKINEALGEEAANVEYLTLEENQSYLYLKSICEKVNIIAWIFPFFFVLVVALVASTTMERMVEEERSIVGCYRSLGFSNKRITAKYMLLGIVDSIVASALGLVAGLYTVTNIIYPVFDTVFYAPTMSSFLNPIMGLIASVLMIAAICIVTAYVVNKFLKQQPASLLLPKSPKAGKKVFLEKVKPVWSRMSFKYKSTVRNLSRYKKNFAMTVISVAGSTALIWIGFALIDVCGALNDSTGENSIAYVGIGSAIKPIAIMIIVFAIALAAVVIYNLINMNISERTREIATLKVLGYKPPEVSGYIYREIFIMAIIGIIIGLPLGILLLWIVMTLLEFGSLADIYWYTYLVAIAIVAAFTLIIAGVMIRRINKINMTDSLKSVD